MEQESTTQKDIDSLLEDLKLIKNDYGHCEIHRDDALRYHAALSALVAERDALRDRVDALRDRVDALRKRVAELESQEFTLPNDPFRDPDSDLRKDLICAVLTGLNSNPELITYAEHFPKFAVNQANEAIAAMRKGESDGK